MADLAELWPRLVAAGVQWRPGMLTVEVVLPGRTIPMWEDARIIAVDLMFSGTTTVCPVAKQACRDIHPGALPDLTDPATLGCLLAEVRRLSEGRAILSTEPVASVVVDYPDGDESYHYPSDIGAPDQSGWALIAALCAILGVDHA